MQSKLLSAAVAVALLGAGVALILTGHSESADGLMAVGLSLAGALGTAALPSLRP